MGVGFAAGVFLVFGASEIIILGVKGLSDKLNWNPYIEGLLQAIGAAIAELVVVIILLVRSYNFEKQGNIAEANNLATTAIVLILTTVIINIFFLGIAMIFVARKNPFDLPHELTFYEANLILGMMVFSFVIMLYGFYFEFTSGSVVTTYNRYFEIVIGIALVLVYIFFVVILITRFGKRTSTPQTLMTEFLPDEDELVVIKPIEPTPQIELRTTGDKPKKSRKSKKVKEIDEPSEVEVNNDARKSRRSHQERSDALATLRRFPWIIIIALFLFGAGGIVWGGEILATSIELGIQEFETNVLLYAVVVGIVASSPELVVTMRGLLSKDKEKEEVGLVHQVSAINQTFFILFGLPFIISGIMGIGIPISMDITIVMGGIFIMSVALILMISDDNKFDLLEGIVVFILSTVSLLALALIGSITAQSESTTSTALQLAYIAKLL
jgi:Ca2+/Na+ antiporter